MTFRTFLAACLVLTLAPPLAAVGHAADSNESRATAGTEKYLPDSTILARVNDRVIRVIDFRRGFFNTLVKYRPATDSLGRAEFLNSMINKEVLALVAEEVARPLTFEDRTTLRSFTKVVLSNALYRRRVWDPATPTEEEVARVHPQFAREIRVRQVLVESRELAERIRRDLLAGRLTWKKAVARYSVAGDRDKGGESDWLKRLSVRGDLGLKLFDLNPSEVSEVAESPDGFHVAQVIEVRQVPLYPLSIVDRVIREDLRTTKSIPLLAAMYAELRAMAGASYDSVAIRNAMLKFRAHEIESFTGEGSIDVSARVPHFTERELDVVLARAGEHEISLREFVLGYQAIDPTIRTKILGMQQMFNTLDAILLEPEMTEYAERAGMEDDPLVRAAVDRQIERMRVEHLYEDSVLSNVTIPEEERRAYFAVHRDKFMTLRRVRYAGLKRTSQASTDSLVEALKGGADVAAIVARDEANGWSQSRILEIDESESNLFTKVLFEELRPGDVTMVGPDQNGDYVVLKSLDFFDSRPMSFEESLGRLDESVRNEKSEALLEALVARHKPRYDIEAHPERLGQVRMLDPVLD